MVDWKEIQSDKISDLESYAREHNIHPLALEDCIHRDQRPKLENYEAHQFLVWFMMVRGQIYELQFVIFPSRILLVPHEPPPEGSTWKEYLKIPDGFKNSWNLLYHALDKLTDMTACEAKELFNKVDEFEDRIFKKKFDPKALLSLKKKSTNLIFQLVICHRSPCSCKIFSNQRMTSPGNGATSTTIANRLCETSVFTAPRFLRQLNSIGGIKPIEQIAT